MRKHVGGEIQKCLFHCQVGLRTAPSWGDRRPGHHEPAVPLASGVRDGAQRTPEAAGAPSSRLPFWVRGVFWLHLRGRVPGRPIKDLQASDPEG